MATCLLPMRHRSSCTGNAYISLLGKRDAVAKITDTVFLERVVPAFFFIRALDTTTISSAEFENLNCEAVHRFVTTDLNARHDERARASVYHALAVCAHRVIQIQSVIVHTTTHVTSKPKSPAKGRSSSTSRNFSHLKNQRPFSRLRTVITGDRFCGALLECSGCTK